MTSKCIHPNCQGVFPEGMLEQSTIEDCGNLLHHPCQTEYERSQNIDLGLHKYCFSCYDRKTKAASPSKVGEKVLPSNPAGRGKEDSADNNESPEIDLRDVVDEDQGCATRKNLPEIIIPANEETIVPELKEKNGFKENNVVLYLETCLQNFFTKGSYYLGFH